MATRETLPPTVTPPPSTRGPRALLSVFLLFGALSFVLLRGTNAVSVLQNEAQISQTLAVKPTIPPPPTQAPMATQTPITPQIYANYLTGTMSLQDKIAQMMMVEIYDSSLTTTDIAMVRQHVGGVVLFGNSFFSTDHDDKFDETDPGQLGSVSRVHCHRPGGWQPE